MYDRLLRAWRHQVMRLLIERAVQEEICAKTNKSIQDKLTSQMEQLKGLQAQNQALNRKLVAKAAALKANFKKTEVGGVHLVLSTKETILALREPVWITRRLSAQVPSKVVLRKEHLDGTCFWKYRDFIWLLREMK